MLEDLYTDLQNKSSPERAVFVSRFFKTGKGQYGEGDIFAGISNPDARAIAKKHAQLPLTDIEKLLQNPIHEYRFVALVLLTNRFTKSNTDQRESLVACYLRNLRFVNNWDLVDTSCHKIIGPYLLNKDRSLLYELVESSDLWTQRISIISTFHFISKGQFSDTLRLAAHLLPHPHDLIHKAVGWMLREVGKRDELVLEEFLGEHTRQMPRTALRYAIEKFPESKRKYYLAL
ncbi:MAG: DNA alkylation repair protein [Cytophagia bacterium]|nr:MAG: DNA alkylation repair protein [Runella sp.]TAG23016.1 MAG: DNA alkylation repair protein [Cytophagales bacterium]TAG42068.1 MAG: DNA alkylation repair protein [Cytophagia bacterium]TAG52818.1 MAG: DNA alkylation repair protein [Runella slithyformis]TAG83764.1 MAG: DNA alkylation repair protein [Cytophagales bacterium]